MEKRFGHARQRSALQYQSQKRPAHSPPAWKTIQTLQKQKLDTNPKNNNNVVVGEFPKLIFSKFQKYENCYF